MESVFGIVIGGWIEQLEFFERNAIKDVFFDDFSKLSQLQFFERSLKNV